METSERQQIIRNYQCTIAKQLATNNLYCGLYSSCIRKDKNRYPECKKQKEER